MPRYLIKNREIDETPGRRYLGHNDLYRALMGPNVEDGAQTLVPIQEYRGGGLKPWRIERPFEVEHKLSQINVDRLCIVERVEE